MCRTGLVILVMLGEQGLETVVRNVVGFDELLELNK